MSLFFAKIAQNKKCAMIHEFSNCDGLKLQTGLKAEFITGSFVQNSNVAVKKR